MNEKKVFHVRYRNGGYETTIVEGRYELTSDDALRLIEETDRASIVTLKNAVKNHGLWSQVQEIIGQGGQPDDVLIYFEDGYD